MGNEAIRHPESNAQARHDRVTVRFIRKRVQAAGVEYDARFGAAMESVSPACVGAGVGTRQILQTLLAPGYNDFHAGAALRPGTANRDLIRGHAGS